MEIRGRVIHSTTEGAMDHMHSMAKKYTGRDTYTPVRAGEVRVMFTIEPAWSSRSGPEPRKEMTGHRPHWAKLLTSCSNA